MSTVARINAEINLKDNLSAPLKEAGDKVRKFSGQARDELGRFTVGARKAWKDFGDELGKFSKKAQMAGLAMTAGLTAPILGFSKIAVDAAAKMEGFRASMTQITGSATASAAQFAELEAMASRTATGYDMLTRASMGLIAAFDGDVKGANAVLERFAILANVMNVSRADFDRVATNLIQIGGTARLAGDELREMSGIIPGFRSLLKDAFGTASTEQLAKYGITGRQALEGIAKAIDAQGFKANTDTYNAQLQILSTEFFKLKVAAGEVFLPIARQVAQLLTPAFQKLAETIKAMTPEQKKAAVALLGIAAAAGPVLMVLGTMGNAVSGLIAGWGTLGKVWGLLSRAIASSGGVLGVVRAAIAALTGPIGIVIAAVTALYLAWKNNFAGIQDVVMPFVRQIEAMLWDLWTNVKSTFDQIWPIIVDTWNTVVRESKPIIDFFVGYLQWHWTNMMTGVTVAFRFITDVINTSLAGWKMIFGAGWSDLSNSMNASLLRMRGIAVTILTNIAQFVVTAFRAMTGWMSAIPGVGDFYVKIIHGAQDRVDALRAEGAAAGRLAEKYQDLADKERKINWPSFGLGQGAPKFQRRISGGGGGFGGGGGAGAGGGSVAPLDPFKVDPALEARLEAMKKLMKETLQLERDLAVEKLRASNAAVSDIISMEKFGKLYKDLTEEVERAYVHRARDLEVFKKEQEALARAAEEQKERLEAAAQAQRDLNNSVWQAAAAYAKEREQINFVTEEERARWEVTKGGYREAHPLAQALYVIQAKLLDQARAAKEAGEKWKAFWSDLIAKHKEWVKDQQGQANERYDEYVKRLTEEMLELSGAQEQVLRNDLAEQFKGFGAGAKDASEAARIVKKKVDEIIGRVRILTDMKEKIAQIREVARAIEDIFKKSLDDLFENGFKGFFSSVVDGFRDLARQIAAEFLKIQLMKALIWGVGSLFGGKAGAEWADALGMGKKKAVGGSAFAGQPYLVGERGPELFVPNVNGSIVRRDEKGSLSPAMAGGPNIVVNLQVPNYSAFKRSEAQLAAQVFARAGRARAREGR